MIAVTAADEVRHVPVAARDWAETWSFEFIAEEASLAGLVRLSLVPGRRIAEYLAVLVGDGRSLIVVRESEAPLPPSPGLDLRAEGLWADHVCETPLEHWTVGLEAFGVCFDDPLDAVGREWGERVGLGFDLEWEAQDAPWPSGPYSYRQPCFVSGDVLVGEERFSVELHGFRSHGWGGRPWSDGLGGRLDDGTWFAADGTGGPPGVMQAGDLCLDVVVRHPAPVMTVVARAGPAPTPWFQAACTVTAADGRCGSAWAAWGG